MNENMRKTILDVFASQDTDHLKQAPDDLMIPMHVNFRLGDLRALQRDTPEKPQGDQAK